jgi:hypothetical protein
MLGQESEHFRELCLYFISSKQWTEAYELHQQAYGSSPADAKTAIRDLANRYGYYDSQQNAYITAAAMLTSVVILSAAALHFMLQ